MFRKDTNIAYRGRFIGSVYVYMSGVYIVRLVLDILWPISKGKRVEERKEGHKICLFNILQLVRIPRNAKFHMARL